MRGDRNIDYLSNYEASTELARMLARWWHRQGYSQVKAWVVKESFNGLNIYVVRSNIEQTVNSTKGVG